MRIFPLWSVPLAAIFFELFVRLRQRGKTLLAILFILLLLADLGITFYWFTHSGWNTFPLYIKDWVEDVKSTPF